MRLGLSLKPRLVVELPPKFTKFPKFSKFCKFALHGLLHCQSFSPANPSLNPQRNPTTVPFHPPPPLLDAPSAAAVRPEIPVGFHAAS